MTIDELMKEAIAVWHREGMDPTDSDTPLYNLHNDPITKLLLGAVNYQSNSISDDIASFRHDLADECLDLAAPDYLFAPIPAIGMLQTAKGRTMGLKNNERTLLDGDVSFMFSKDVGTKRVSFPFMPLLSIAVMDYAVRSVVKVERNRWRLEIEDMENAKKLEGLSFYIPALEKAIVRNENHYGTREYDDRIKIYAGDTSLPVCNISDFDRLPFVSKFMNGLMFSKNAMQCNVLQNIQDSFCCNISNFCVVDRYDEEIPIPHRDGCIILDIVLPELDASIDLSANDILLNCVPIVNVESHSTDLTQYNPVQPIELDDGFFLTTIADDSNNDDSFAVRKVATSRMSPEQWSVRMCQLIDHYNAQHNVMQHLLDDKLNQAMQTVLVSLKQSLEKQRDPNYGIYLVLKNKMQTSVSASWLSTLGKMANDIEVDLKPQCSSSELDSDRSKLVTKTSGGRDPITDSNTRQRAMRYYQISRDRIVSKSDLVTFCRHKLVSMFSLSSADIQETRIYDTVRNSSEGFYERLLVVDIKVRQGSIDTYRASNALERMIRFRTVSPTPVKVIINE